MRTALFVAFGLLLGHASPALGANLKIGYVDMSRALNEVQEGKAAKASLKSEFDKKQKSLDDRQEKLKAKQQEFEKKQGMMNDAAKQKKLEELQRDFFQLQQTYGQMQRELLEREGQLTADITKRLQKVVDKIGDREGYNIILNIGDTVMYYKSHLEITDQVVREYDKIYAAKK